MRLTPKKLLIVTTGAALCLSAVANWSRVQAQQANELRRTLDANVPLSDDDLDGRDDNSPDSGDPLVRSNAPQVIFTDDIEQADANRARDSDAFSDDRNRDSEDSFRQRENRNPFANDDGRSGAARPAGRQNQSAAAENDGQGSGNNRARRARQVGIITASGDTTPLSQLPALPIERERDDPEEDPFAALGIRLGSFTLFPVLTQELGWSSNADSLENGEGSAFSQSDAQLEFISDWARHELRGQIGGSYQKFLTGETENLPTANASADLRLDISRELTARAGFDYNLTTESPSSDNLDLPVGEELDGRPTINDLASFAEISRTSGRLTTRLRGTITRTTFGDVSVVSGASADQEDRNNTLYVATAQAAYEVSPAFQPFAQISVGGRSYDKEVDRGGNRRSSAIYEAQAGFSFNLSEKLNGTLGVGYRAEDFDDEALDTLASPLVNAQIIWSPERFTTITTDIASTLAGSAVQDENGSAVHSLGITAEREIRPDFSVNARLFGSYRVYDTSDREDMFLQAELGAEWRFNRAVSLIGRVGYEQAISNEDGSSFDAFTARAGLRFQR